MNKNYFSKGKELTDEELEEIDEFENSLNE